MHEHDPERTRGPLDTPVVPTTPVVHDTMGPVNPVMVETEYHRTTNYFPYIAAFLLAVFGIWGLLALNHRDDDRRADRTTDVAYVEQRLETKPTLPNGPLQVTSTRMAEDRMRDDMRQLRRDEMARDSGRIDDYAVTADPYDNQVATADLTESMPRDSQSNPPARSDSQGAAQNGVLTNQTADQGPREIAVLDLDYSNTEMAPLTEQELEARLTQLDADVDATEKMAREVGQLAAVEILDERVDALEDRLDDTARPMTEADRLTLTRMLSELRDELTAFQTELRDLP